MPEYRIRPMEPADRPALDVLLDETIGRGFWDPLRDLQEIVVVAVAEERVVGVASANVQPDPDASGLVGHVRLVAVRHSARRQGIATRLVSEVSTLCESLGATRLLAYAWVHQDLGAAPLAGALVSAGYLLGPRIEGFYGGTLADACPACGRSPCICAADVFVRNVLAEAD